MAFGQCRKPKYYRDKRWEPPRDLVIPPNFPVQYASPTPNSYQAPGYQSHHQGPSYHSMPTYRPMTVPSHFVPMLPASSTLMPSRMIQDPAIAHHHTIANHPTTIQYPSTTQYPTIPQYTTMAQHPPMPQYPAIAQHPAIARPSVMMPIPQASRHHGPGPAYGAFVPPRY
ncbi:hypothetical protein F4825DRAFT_401847 [Nemania diffusa]|nr:hypothetical protein F4825DRAFT_401847 [Nemania diffusa]